MRADLFTTYPEPPPPIPEGACHKCAGSRVFTSHTGRVVGECFSCKGTGMAAPVASEAVAVEAGQLLEAFERASAAGLRRPRLHFGEYVVSLAPPGGKNPGALYVKGAGAEGVYLGKVVGGRLLASRDCTPEVRDALAQLMSDPAEAVRAYGQRSGSCAICNRQLTERASVERGIGPICAERFGF
jgi:hypothetical protein